MIAIDNMTVRYGDTAPVEGFSLAVAAGESVVLTGASGRGKTTVLNAVAGFVVPSAGSVSVGGTVLSPQTIAAVRRQIAYLPQAIDMDLPTGRDLLLYPVSFKANAALRPDERQIGSMLERLGLEQRLLGQRLGELSGGQKQRVALASVLFLRRPVLLLDEPTSALDGDSIGAVLDTVLSQRDTTLLSVSHDSRWIGRMQRNVTL